MTMAMSPGVVYHDATRLTFARCVRLGDADVTQTATGLHGDVAAARGVALGILLPAFYMLLFIM